ncbi:Hypothetical protein AA314_05110 [Archangium gephyra]|uniref:Uncharacterized protein n=1 Tax=Archangium gephyra TaxID=48 RepID=A0AAC8Q9P0_9BACT|nr:Hypothetical protein AA314_05110 [Archangium gephyra]
MRLSHACSHSRVLDKRHRCQGLRPRRPEGRGSVVMTSTGHV